MHRFGARRLRRSGHGYATGIGCSGARAHGNSGAARARGFGAHSNGHAQFSTHSNGRARFSVRSNRRAHFSASACRRSRESGSAGCASCDNRAHAATRGSLTDSGRAAGRGANYHALGPSERATPSACLANLDRDKSCRACARRNREGRNSNRRRICPHFAEFDRASRVSGV